MDTKDLRCLQPRQWLNGAVLSYHIGRYISEFDSIYNFSPQLYGQIVVSENKHGATYEAYLAACGMTHSFDWSLYRYVQVPICDAGHWSLLVIENPWERENLCVEEPGYSPSVYYHVDSISQYHVSDEVVARVRRYVGFELQKKQNVAHSMKTRTVKVATNPQQHNAYDCGLYVLHYMMVINRSLHENRTSTLKKRIRTLCRGLTGKECRNLRLSMLELYRSDTKYKALRK